MHNVHSPAGGLPSPPWHLPGVERPGAWEEGRTAAGAAFCTPRLSAETARKVAARVRCAALACRERLTAGEVIRHAGRAASRLGDPEDPAGAAARELLEAELGWPVGMVDTTLGEMAEGWTPEVLLELVREELGSTEVLDGFRPAGRPGGRERRRRAVGPPLLFQVQAGNVPGVAVTGVLRGLLARSGVLVRAPQEEPGLVPLFARVLAEEEPGLGASVASTWWAAGGEAREGEAAADPHREDATSRTRPGHMPRGEGGDPPRPAGELWVKRAGKVVVYGGTQAVEALRRRVPAGTELLVYGPRLGVAVLLPDADPKAAAKALARDVCAYEQRGCLSPRLVFLVGQGPPDGEERRRAFARRVHEALGDEVKRTGMRPLTAGEAAAVRNLRAREELRWEPEDVEVLGADGEPGWTVITGREPELRTEALARVVRIYGTADLRAWAEAMAPLEGHLQAAGYAGSEGADALAARAAELGVSRVAPLGTVAWPPADWRHDGRHQLLPLLRWTDWELTPS